MFEIFTTVTYSSGFEYVSVDGKTPHTVSTSRLSSNDGQATAATQTDRQATKTSDSPPPPNPK